MNIRCIEVDVVALERAEKRIEDRAEEAMGMVDWKVAAPLEVRLHRVWVMVGQRYNEAVNA